MRDGSSGARGNAANFGAHPTRTLLISNDQVTGGSAIGTASTAWKPLVIDTG